MDTRANGEARRTGEQSVSFAMRMIPRTVRPYCVCNGYGEHLASFAEWEAAHVWAHDQAQHANAVLPIEIEDRSQRITRRITRDFCELIAWTMLSKDTSCDRGSGIPPYLPEQSHHAGG